MASDRPNTLASRIFTSDDLLIEASKIMLTGFTCAVWVLGYAYAHAFYYMFGIFLSDLELSLFEFIFRGVFFFASLNSLTAIVVILVLFTILVMLAIRSRTLVVEIPLYLVSFALLIGASVILGRQLANDQVRLIEQGVTGRLAHCLMAPSTDAEQEQINAFLEGQGAEGNLRFIAKSKDHHHFVVLVDEASRAEAAQDRWIKSYAIATDQIRFCSFTAPIGPALGGLRARP